MGKMMTIHELHELGVTDFKHSSFTLHTNFENYGVIQMVQVNHMDYMLVSKFGSNNVVIHVIKHAQYLHIF